MPLRRRLLWQAGALAALALLARPRAFAVFTGSDESGSRNLYLMGGALVVALSLACATPSSQRRSQSKASLVEVTPEPLQVVGKLPICQPSLQLPQHCRTQMVQWLRHSGASELLAQTSSHALLFLLDHMAWTRGLGKEVRDLSSLQQVGIVICPYEMLPKVLASQKANRTLCTGGGSPPFTVRETADWERLRDCVDQVDWAGGLLLRPTGAVYAVLERNAAASEEARASMWQSIAAKNAGVICLLAAWDASAAFVDVFHSGRQVRITPAASFAPSRAQNMLGEADTPLQVQLGSQHAAPQATPQRRIQREPQAATRAYKNHQASLFLSQPPALSVDNRRRRVNS